MTRALVTGGSGTIGASIAHALAAAGMHVYVHAHSEPARAEQVAAEIRSRGGSAEAVCFDVTKAAETQAALERMLEPGPIQIIVNNAGIHDDAVMPGMRREQWTRVIDVSLNGFFNVTQPLLLPMIRTRWGRIINISSVAALTGNRGQVNYAAAKAGCTARPVRSRSNSRAAASRSTRSRRASSHRRATEGVFPRERSTGWCR